MKEDFVAELQSRFPAAITEPESAAVGTEIRSIFKWLKSLPVEMSGAETFIRVVAQCVLGHVAAVTTMTPHESPEHYKQLKVDEKNTFQAFGAILQVRPTSFCCRLPLPCRRDVTLCHTMVTVAPVRLR